MNQCRGCAIYEEYFDTMQRTDVGPEEPDPHYCVAYISGMPEGVWEGMEKCPRRFVLDRPKQP